MTDRPPFTTNATTTTTTAAAISSLHQSHSDSIESSPRSRIIENWEEGLSLVPGGAKLRLMCSYGGHIVPRPHSKSLFYVGGETRMVVADRHSSLADLSARLSRTLLNGRCFALKYQIPNEDLDSLISVITDEDLDNMIEEYDRTTTATAASPLKPTRLRLFLFLAKPETATSMGNLLEDAKSESWFVDTLNGSAGLLPRGLSDSAAFDSVLNLDDHNHSHDNGVADGSLVSKSHDNDHDHANDSSLYPDLEAQNCHDPRMGHDKLEAAILSNSNKLHSDQIVINDTSNSSFESSSSSPSMSNLPPIRTRVDDEGVANNYGSKFCLDGNFALLGVSPTLKKQDDGVALTSLTLPSAPDVVIEENNPEQVVSNDESSELGVVQARFRKPPLPLQDMHYNTDVGAATTINLLHSPDSIASENSLASVSSLSTSMHYDPVHAGSRESRYSAIPNDPKTDTSEPSSQPQIQPAQESIYVILPHLHQPQQQHQQYLQPGAHYIHHPGTGLVQVSPYYPMFAPPPLQQLHQRMDQQQIPMYTMSLTQPHSYTVGVQDNSTATLGRPSTPTPPNAVMVAQAATTYTESLPPVYPTQKTTETPQLIQVPPNQIQQQYVGFSQLQNPAHSIAATNYAYEYSHPGYEQAYYTNHPASMMPAQYQTMNQSSAVYLSEAAPSPQQQTENNK